MTYVRRRQHCESTIGKYFRFVNTINMAENKYVNNRFFSRSLSLCSAPTILTIGGARRYAKSHLCFVLIVCNNS